MSLLLVKVRTLDPRLLDKCTPESGDVSSIIKEVDI